MGRRAGISKCPLGSSIMPTWVSRELEAHLTSPLGLSRVPFPVFGVCLPRNSSPHCRFHPQELVQTPLENSYLHTRALMHTQTPLSTETHIILHTLILSRHTVYVFLSKFCADAVWYEARFDQTRAVFLAFKVPLSVSVLITITNYLHHSSRGRHYCWLTAKEETIVWELC